MQKKPHQAEARDKHPDEYKSDLNRDPAGGQNIGVESERPQKAEGHSAFDMKQAHDLLPDVPSDDLKELRVLPPGTRLLARATYLDLRHRERGEIKAEGTEIAGNDNWYVEKKDVDYELWNRLLGIRDLKRTGTAG
ncbi:MAG: hypothetical protein QM820_56375 [Minicystis sp.]